MVLVKKRFGISLSDNLYENLNELSSLLQRNRSELIEEAVKTFINDYKHYLIPHNCTGVMIISCKSEDMVKSMIDRYSDIAKTYIHTHENNTCIEIIFISGPSKKIVEFQKGLEKEARCTSRYVPLSMSSFEGEDKGC